MRFSLQVRYAVSGLFDLAYNAGGEPVQVRVIGARQAMPARYLEQIFQRLRRAGLVTGKRGPGGGYTLARPPSEINLRDVVEALEGPAAEWFLDRDQSEAMRHRPDFVWTELAERMAATLGDFDLEELCRRAARDGLPHADTADPMYFI